FRCACAVVRRPVTCRFRKPTPSGASARCGHIRRTDFLGRGCCSATRSTPSARIGCGTTSCCRASSTRGGCTPSPTDSTSTTSIRPPASDSGSSIEPLDSKSPGLCATTPDHASRPCGCGSTRRSDRAVPVLRQQADDDEEHDGYRDGRYYFVGDAVDGVGDNPPNEIGLLPE